jgi:hypothetical protein
MMANKILGTILLTGLSVSLFAQSNLIVYSLDFNAKKYEKQNLEYNGVKIDVRAYEKIVYVANPVDTAYEVMNIYIPEAYFNGESINGYTTETAPIFFPNQIGAYMPAKPASTKNNGFGEMMPPRGGNNGAPPQGMRGDGRPPMGNGGPVGDFGKRENTVLAALSKGYVVASAGARGRTNKDLKGLYYGKAPAGIVDLKAAVRYLKYNDKVMSGDANKIISNGTSAGGAMSTLLGATGDNPDYLPYLKELGAANTSDDIFACSAYCPITNLDHADAAYEWQFYGVNSYQKRGPSVPQGNAAAPQLSEAQIKVSGDLKEFFPAYVNSLHLKATNGEVYTLNANGNGNFKTLVKSYLIASAQKALEGGTDLSKLAWLKIENKKVTDLDWDAYVRYMQRQKTPPAFDALDLTSPENSLFGTSTIDKQHFTVYGIQNTIVKGNAADDHIIRMMNPMNYIGTPNTQTAKHWRIRHGSKDKDTGLAISVILATCLQNNGNDVNMELPWDRPHSGDYDLDELFKWVDGISKK